MSNLTIISKVIYWCADTCALDFNPSVESLHLLTDRLCSKLQSFQFDESISPEEINEIRSKVGIVLTQVFEIREEEIDSESLHHNHQNMVFMANYLKRFFTLSLKESETTHLVHLIWNDIDLIVRWFEKMIEIVDSNESVISEYCDKIEEIEEECGEENWEIVADSQAKVAECLL